MGNNSKKQPSMAEIIKKKKQEEEKANPLKMIVGAEVGEDVKPLEHNRVVVPVGELKKVGRPAGKRTKENSDLVQALVDPAFGVQLEMAFIKNKKTYVTKGAFYGELLKLGLAELNRE